jgi:hypothetical protein
MLDLNPTKVKRQAFSERVNDLLSAELQRKRDAQPKREYLGASALGGDCERSLQFEFAGAPREREFKPETLRKFDFGHFGEEWARQEFRSAGFDLRQRDRRGELYSFTQMGGRLKGHPDGVFVAGPEDAGLAYPCLWECKSVGAKTYREIERDGLRKARFTYFAQVHIYMAYLELTENPALFTVTNLDTGEQMHLSIPFDAEVAQTMTDRAVRIIKATDAGELLPRPFASPDHFKCRTMCDFPARCWRFAG